jgi:hypothetical protein
MKAHVQFCAVPGTPGTVHAARIRETAWSGVARSEGFEPPAFRSVDTPYGHPYSFRSVRHLGGVPVGCPVKSGEPGESFIRVAPSVAPSWRMRLAVSRAPGMGRLLATAFGAGTQAAYGPPEGPAARR